MKKRKDRVKKVRQTSTERAASVIRRVRREHPMRDLRLPSARELARVLKQEGLLR